MSDVLDLFARLRALNVKLELNQGKLKLDAPKGVLSDELKKELSENKDALIAFLTQAQAQTGTSGKASLLKAPDEAKQSKSIPATDSQARFWFLDKLFPADPSFNIPALLEVRGELNLELFEKSVKLLIQRHESLRLCFIEKEGKPFLNIPQDIDWSLELNTQKINSSEALDAFYKQASISALTEGFDLAEAPLMRLELFKLEKAYPDVDQRPHFLLLCCVHHIVCDAWSIGLILKDIASIYLGLLQGNQNVSEGPEFNFSDFAYSQIQEEEKQAEHLDYWKKQIKGAKGLLHFPYDHARPLKPSSSGASLDFNFDKKQSEAIKRFCSTHQLTPFMFFMAAYHVCLSLYCKETDICAGIPIAGRTSQEVENIVGLFLNALIIRSKPEKNKNVFAYLQQIRTDILQGFDYQSVGIDTLIDHLNVDREHDEVPGVQFGFNFQNAGQMDQLEGFESSLLSLKPVALESKTAKHDLCLTMGEVGECFLASLEYRDSLLDEVSIETFSSHYMDICEQFLNCNENSKLKDFSLFSIETLAKQLGLEHSFAEQAIQDICPLTLSQEGFYFNDLVRSDNQSTLIGTSILVEGDFNLALWKQSLQDLSDQRAVLRMQIFPCENKLANAAYQVIFNSLEIDYQEIDAHHLSLEQAQLEAKKIIYTPFLLHKSSLIRYRVFCLSEKRYLLVTSMHHTLMDAISALQHWTEAQAIYEGKCIAEDTYRSYLDFATTEIDKPEVLAYWQNALSGVEALDYSVHGSGAGNAFHVHGERQLKRLMVDGDEWEACKHYCRKQGITPAILYKVVFAYLAKTWCQPESDFFIHEIITGRPAEFSKTLGNCFLIQPFIFKGQSFEGSNSVEQTFSDAKNQQKQHRAFALLSQQSFQTIQKNGRVSFFYNYLNFIPPDDFLGKPVVFRDWGNEIDEAVEFNPRLGPDGLELNLFYREALFSEDNFLELVQTLVSSLIEGLNNFDEFIFATNHEFSHAALLSTPANLKQQALESESTTVIDLFLKHVQTQPDAPALLGTSTVSYTELEKLSAKMANYFKAQGVGSGDLVVLELEKSEHLIAAILASLRMGAQYLPLDSSLPDERKQFIKQNSNAAFIFDASKLAHYDAYEAHFSKLNISLDAPAYTIYTSGSTGEPKGVQVSHGALVRTYLAWEESFSLQHNDRHLQMASVGFDVFTGDWVRALCSGAALCLVDKLSLMDSKCLLDLIETHEISIAEFVPAVLRNLCQLCEEQNKQLGLRMLMVGSDAWFDSDQKRLETVTQAHCLLINSYGVTEACIDSSFALIERGKHKSAGEASMLSIGQALANTALYVLDAKQRLLPKDVVGELYIAGGELADGYVGDEQKTRESFLPDSIFPQTDNARMYRTGDKAVLNHQNDLILLGRIGQQVKIRGFRVELGEIENQIAALNEVDECVVLAQELNQQNDQQLIAYVVFHEGEQLKTSELKLALAKHLPEYMLPQLVVALEEIPLNANGKLDRKALPQVDLAELKENEFVAPRNATEQILSEIWQQVLGVETVGVHDNFFELGGHSLLATQVTSRIKQEFHRELPLKEIFEKPSIAELANELDALLIKPEHLVAPEILPVERQTLMPVSYAQRRFWFLDRLLPGFFAYNMPFGLKVKGNFNVDVFQEVLTEIIQRHELLRCNFVSEGDGVFATVTSCEQFPLGYSDVSGQVDASEKIQKAIEENAHKSFALDKDLLLRCSVIKLSDKEYMLLGCLHHIIADGWSVRILFQEIALLYNAISEGRSSPLSPLVLHYLDFAAWEQTWLQGEVLEQYTQYWLNALEGAPQILKLPTDKPRPLAQTFNGKQISKTLSLSFKNKLKRFATQENVSLFMTLMTAMSILMSRYTGEKDILIGTPVAGRNNLATEKIIGLFLNAVIIRSRLENNPNVRQLLNQVKESCLGAFAHQDMPAEILFEKVANHRDPQYPAGAQVGLVLQNTASQATHIDAQQFGEHLQGLSAELVGTEQVISNYDFGFTVVDLDEGLQVIAEFNTDLFFDSTIEQMLEQYLTILDQMIETPELSVDSIDLVEPDALLQHLGLDSHLYEDALPLTAMQQGMFLANKLNPQSREYGVGFSVRIKQVLDVDLWTECLQGLIDTQCVTRVVFAENNVPYLDDVYQLVLKNKKAKVELLDWSTQNKSEAEIEALASQFINAPYNLLKDEVMRVMLIKVREDYYVGVFGAHHILMDGISVVAFGVMGAMNYEIISNGGKAIVHQDAYKDFLYQNRKEMDTQDVLAFWKQRLQNPERNLEALEYPVKAEVLRDLQNPAEKSKKSLTLSSEHWLAIQVYCKQNRITPALYFKALYALVLAKYCRADEDFYLFEILAGRPANQMNALGCYFQQIPLVIEKETISADSGFKTIVKQLRQQQKQSKHQQLISVPAQMSLLPEAQVSFMYNFEHYIPDFFFMGQPVEIQEYSNQVNGIVQLLVKTLAQSVQLNLQSQKKFFDDFKMLERMEQMSQSIIAGEDAIAHLSLLDHEEKNQQLKIWNQAPVQNVQTVCVHEAIEQACESFSSHIAVKDSRGELTYQQLNEQANQLARYLQNQGVTTGDVVGICLPLCKEVPLAILAVLKTGAAYLPMDSRYPDERLKYFIDTSNPKLILSHNVLSERINLMSPQSNIYSIYSDEHKAYENHNLNLSLSTDNLLYVLYTSGSTGLPNCTASYHRCEMNLIEWYCGEFNMNADDHLLVVSALGFDLTQKNLMAPLTCGASISFYDAEIYDNQAILDLIESQSISWINCAPSAFYPLCSDEHDFSQLDSIRWVFLGGEALVYERLKKWHQASTGKLVNSYGPSECTDISSYYVLEKEHDYQQVPLGKANSNVLLYVMDQHRNLLPAGLPGELYVGGAGVGAGYLNNPELTARKFFENPFAEGKIYKTGDLVRYIDHGDLLYIGRTDFQIKRRGVRIEPAEIESLIKSVEGVRDCLVLQDDLGKLLAYVLSPDFASSEELISSTIDRQLRQQLSPAMLPDEILVLAAFPLSPNGKIDRTALPKPVQKTRQLVEAESDTEKTLMSIWREILNIQDVSRYDNFFEIGGHSLLAVQLISRINQAFKLELPLAVLFEAQTLDALAIKIDGADISHWQHLVSIKQSRDSKAKVFCIHPVGGEVLCYREFSRCLPEDVEVFAIQAKGLLQTQEAVSSSSVMLNDYSQSILESLTESKDVPVYLAGQSLGGVFALALAQQLSEQGVQIKGVAMFDSFVPNTQNLEMIGIGHLQSALGAFMQLDEHELSQLPELDQLKMIFDQAKSGYLIPQEIEFSQVSSRYLLAKANIQIASELKLQTAVNFQVLHVEAETSLSGLHSGEDWKPLLKDAKFVSTPGHHESIMQGANAQTLAKHFINFIQLLEH